MFTSQRMHLSRPPQSANSPGFSAGSEAGENANLIISASCPSQRMDCFAPRRNRSGTPPSPPLPLVALRAPLLVISALSPAYARTLPGRYSPQLPQVCSTSSHLGKLLPWFSAHLVPASADTGRNLPGRSAMGRLLTVFLSFFRFIMFNKCMLG